jgi:hypothetical protein
MILDTSSVTELKKLRLVGVSGGGMLGDENVEHFKAVQFENFVREEGSKHLCPLSCVDSAFLKNRSRLGLLP